MRANPYMKRQQLVYLKLRPKANTAKKKGLEKERLDLLKALQESHTWIEFFALFSWLQYNDLFDVPVLKVMAHNVERKITKRFCIILIIITTHSLTT